MDETDLDIDDAVVDDWSQMLPLNISDQAVLQVKTWFELCELTVSDNVPTFHFKSSRLTCYNISYDLF